MAGLVEELQADALDESIHIMALMRKAKAVSVKLNAPSISTWIDNELQGYRSSDDIPNYRHVRGSLVCYNDIHGHIPLTIDNPHILETVTTRKISQPLGRLCEHAANNDRVVLPFPAKLEEKLLAGMNLRMTPGLQIESSSLKNIIYGVRDRVLQFALELESQGIHGEGMGFSKEEKAAAASITYNTITIGSMHNSQIQQDSDNSNQYYGTADFKKDLEKFVSELKNDVNQLKGDDEAKQSLRADLDTIKAQLSSSSPKKTILRECLISVRNILEGATGGVLTNYVPLAAQLIAACS
ncbi:hypothetical protein GIW50_20670 [Pseudomonas syringae]|uniref:AbiTii domain-containing protein n=1 Tax=Pseudomonas syringae TaxID=317 RepID=A0A9Q3X0H2_PSESX|nr:hypothetical protein [Pseudomonas syringae]MCF5061655.1 hypothetical protein [Pseudomonas syringae]MCF5075806.1 hypothetical protein [Pseudomonas syringae]MCF5120806.1 hypothetical protein [Pseudomonas syringae]MCF5377685.1 hypothetical protein [Pseudomonas syringae]